MSVAKYTEEEFLALKSEANDRIRDLTAGMQSKYDKLELELAESKARCIRSEQAYGKWNITRWSWPMQRKKRREVQRLNLASLNCWRDTMKRKNNPTKYAFAIETLPSLQDNQKLKQQNEAIQTKYNKLVEHAKVGVRPLLLLRSFKG